MKIQNNGFKSKTMSLNKKSGKKKKFKDSTNDSKISKNKNQKKLKEKVILWLNGVVQTSKKLIKKSIIKVK